jgi:hypothetical protein
VEEASERQLKRAGALERCSDWIEVKEMTVDAQQQAEEILDHSVEDRN